MYLAHYNKRRSIFAVVLLATMMLQMGFKTFHQHHHAAPTEASCSDCNQHRVHSGHIQAWDGHSGVCTLCQMLQSAYVPPQLQTLVCAQLTHYGYDTIVASDVVDATWCHIFLRGPPSSLL